MTPSSQSHFETLSAQASRDFFATVLAVQLRVEQRGGASVAWRSSGAILFASIKMKHKQQVASEATQCLSQTWKRQDGSRECSTTALQFLGEARIFSRDVKDDSTNCSVVIQEQAASGCCALQSEQALDVDRAQLPNPSWQ